MKRAGMKSEESGVTSSLSRVHYALRKKCPSVPPAPEVFPDMADIDIPPDILVRCPLRDFDLARAQRCDGCEHFAGLSEALGSGSFQTRFLVRCKWPQDRQLFRLAPAEA